MEKVFFVKNGNLTDVNNWLQRGGKVKMIVSVPQVVSSGGEGLDEKGDIFAYVVVE